MPGSVKTRPYAKQLGTANLTIFVYTGLPEENDAFGDRTLTLTDENGRSVTATVQVFFSTEATNHPGDGFVHPVYEGKNHARTPNWMYYWMQTSAGSAGRDKPVYFGGAGSSVGWYVGRKMQAFLILIDGAANKLKPSTDIPKNGHVTVTDTLEDDVNTLGGLPENTASLVVKGIDNFAWALRHEVGHYEDITGWWLMGHPHDSSGFHYIHDPDCDDVPSRPPRDEDFEAPEDIEGKDGLNPASPRSFPDAFPSFAAGATVPDAKDTDLIVFFHQACWNLGSAKREDWSYDGQQSQE